MKPRPSWPQRVAAPLIESAAQSHSGAREHSLRKPNPFKADLSTLSGPPRLIGKHNKENALNHIKWIFYGRRGGKALEYRSATCQRIKKTSKQYLNATGYHHISHLLNLSNMTSHNSCISYPPWYTIKYIERQRIRSHWPQNSNLPMCHLCLESDFSLISCHFHFPWHQMQHAASADS